LGQAQNANAEVFSAAIFSVKANPPWSLVVTAIRNDLVFP
jgi:hypothetical protein